LGGRTQRRIAIFVVFAAEEDEPRGAVNALVEESERRGRHQFLPRAELDNGKRTRR